MNYCNKVCKEKAWADHHELECEFLKNLKEQRVTTGHHSLHPLPLVVEDSLFRAAIRLVLLHKAQKLDDDGWKEITKLLNDDNEEKWRSYARIIKEHTMSELSYEQITQLVGLISQERFRAIRPTRRGVDIEPYEAYDRMTDTRGYCFDPFVSFLSDEALPNTWWVFDGSELRFFPRRNIRAGEYLAVSYTSDRARNDYELHEDEDSGLTYNCSCSLHKLKHNGWEENDLRELDITLLGKYPGKRNISQIQLLLNKLVDGGVEKDNPHMSQLHQLLLLGQLDSKAYTLALKTALELYYVIEPARNPPQLSMDRVNTLYLVVITIMKHLDWVRIQKGPMDRRPLKTDFIHRAKLVSEVEKCFGADSIIAAHERRRFQMCKELMRDNLEIDKSVCRCAGLEFSPGQPYFIN